MSIAATAGLLCVVVAASCGGARAQSDERPSTSIARQQQIVFKSALRGIAPSVVRIDTIGGAQPVRRSAGPGKREETAPTFRQADGPTTGVIWSSDGYVVTSSFNFVREPSIATVTLADGRRFVARLVARDHPARLALLKVEAEDLPTPEWVDKSELRPGQWALAAGYGYGGNEPAVSVGVLSARSRMSGLAVQTDARISPAHYGGPLFDVEGRVMGICVPMGPGDDELAGVEWYDSGIGFAIHYDHIKRRMARLMEGRDLRRGLVGINLDLRRRAVGDAVSDDSAPPPDGVVIVGQPRGPAAEAGLLAGDVITHIDGASTPRLIDFKRAVAEKADGDEINLRYRRGAESAEVTLKLAAPEDFTRPASQEP